jgi:hypothetical protein
VNESGSGKISSELISILPTAKWTNCRANTVKSTVAKAFAPAPCVRVWQALAMQSVFNSVQEIERDALQPTGPVLPEDRSGIGFAWNVHCKFQICEKVLHVIIVS